MIFPWSFPGSRSPRQGGQENVTKSEEKEIPEGSKPLELLPELAGAVGMWGKIANNSPRSQRVFVYLGIENGFVLVGGKRIWEFGGFGGKVGGNLGVFGSWESLGF